MGLLLDLEPQFEHVVVVAIDYSFVYGTLVPTRVRATVLQSAGSIAVLTRTGPRAALVRGSGVQASLVKGSSGVRADLESIPPGGN